MSVYYANIKAIGTPGQNFHFELFERAPLGGTKAFYRMSKSIFVQKLLDFEGPDTFGVKYLKI